MRSLLILFLVACRVTHPTSQDLQPPVAAKHPHQVLSANGTRSDPYFWLRDDTRKNNAVLGYLAAENAYAKAKLAPAHQLEDTLVAEIRARVDEEEATAPVYDDGYWYYSRHERGKERAIYARRKATLDAPEQIVLDANQLAIGHAFYGIGSYDVSRDGNLVAWTDDAVGRNQFTLHVKSMQTGEVLADTAQNVAPSLAWANDNQTVFYVGKDATTLREDRVVRHHLGGGDEVVYQEPDGAYYVDVGVTKSHRFITIEMDATDTSETRLVDADRPASPARVFLPRQDHHIYKLDHLGHRFVIRTDDGAENSRIVEVDEGHETDRSSWRELVPHRSDALVEDFAVYDTFVAAGVRIDGLRRIEVLPAHGKAFYVDATEPAYAMTLVDTPDATSTHVRYAYDSLTSPHAIYDADIATGARTLLRQDKVPTYDADKYTTEYVRAPAHDGAQIPVSIVHRKDTPLDGTAPLLVFGYGAYGDSLDPSFDRIHVSLLDRGFVYAIAHVRGGQELGHAWYDAGRLMHKMNTFTDFIAVTEYLVAHGYGARKKVFAEGASAGGLLMSAVANLRPDLYRGMIVWVPFVDVVTTMLDETIPLVTNEYDEWGDPRDKAAYDYMLRYSPYDNVKPQPYPALYVRSGLWDSQVQYYEPAKWVAKLRATKTDRHLLLFETDMHAGHEGTSGRYEVIREEARAYAFMLYVLAGAS